MSTTQSHSRRDIQGLRAVAVLVVIAFHAGLPVPGGFVGVDVFFVISGFVITAMLHREWLRAGSIQFRRFYARRFKRLTPALALMLSIVLVMSTAMPDMATPELAAKTALGAMFLVANVVIANSTGGYFDPAAEINPLLNTWSLSVEEQFYLVFPALLVVGWWLVRRRVRGAAVVLVSGVAVLSFGAAYLNSIGQVGPRTEFLFGFYGPVSRAWEFAVGALLALALARLQRWPGWSAHVLAVLGAVALLASLWLIDDSTPFPGPWTVLPVVGTAALIIAGSRAQPDIPGISQLLATRPMVAVGDWSYSLYLWHWPLIVFAALLWPDNDSVLLVAAVVSIAPALASYRWVEQPIRHMATPRPRRFVTAVAALIAVVCAISGVTLWIASSLAPQVIGRYVALDKHRVWADCFRPATSIDDSPLVDPKCAYGSSQGGGTVWLLGDSQAAQLVEGLDLATRVQNLKLAVGTSPGCPLMDLDADGFDPAGKVIQSDSCRMSNRHNLAILSGEAASVVFVGMSPAYWGDAITYRRAGKVVAGGDERKEYLHTALVASIRKLQNSGHQVVLVAPFFNFDGQAFGRALECSALSAVVGRCGSDPDPQVVNASPADVLARAEVAAIAKEVGADLVDFGSVQCSESHCLQVDDLGPRYMDATHVSPGFSRQLANQYLEFLRSAS